MSISLNTLTEKAVKLAKLDHELNGEFRNAPYIVTDDSGYPHKASIKVIDHVDGSYSTRLEIVRPAEIVASVCLISNQPPLSELVDPNDLCVTCQQPNPPYES